MAVVADSSALLFQPFFKIPLGRTVWNVVVVAKLWCGECNNNCLE